MLQNVPLGGAVGAQNERFRTLSVINWCLDFFIVCVNAHFSIVLFRSQNDRLKEFTLKNNKPATTHTSARSFIPKNFKIS